MTYPFVVSRRKVVKVTADSYDNALNKVLMKNPVKIITTTFAQNLAGRKHLPTTPEALKIEHLKYKPLKIILNTMDLISAKVEAANVSKKERKRIYIYIDGEGECLLTSIQPKNKDLVQAVFVNGAEIKLEDIEQQTILTTMETKKKVAKPAAKKTTKKVTAVKKAPGKKILKPAIEEIKGGSIIEGVKNFLKSGLRNTILKVAGKTIAIKKGTNFVLSQSLVTNGKDAIIMVIDGHNGFYNFPSSKYKEVFGNIMKSGTWEKTGSYGQSKFSSKWDEFWFDLK